MTLPPSWTEHPFDAKAAFAETGPGYYDDPSSVRVLDPDEAHQQARVWTPSDDPILPAVTGRLDTPEADEHRALEKAVDEGTIALRHLDLFLRWLGRYENAAPAEYQQLADALSDAVERYEKRLDKRSSGRG